MTYWRVERHSKGWAVVKVEPNGFVRGKTVVAVYATKAEAELHADAQSWVSVPPRRR